MPEKDPESITSPAAVQNAVTQLSVGPTYTIVIPAWNEANHIRGTLESVLETQAQSKAQQKFTGDIVVVDNNCTDDTASIARSMGARVVFEPINQIARARNTGASGTDADFLIFLDADTLVNPSLLDQTLNALANGQVIGGGSTVELDRDTTGLVRLALNGWNWWSVKSSTAAGSYLFCTHEAFDTVGGFDEKQYAAEEVVLSKALRKLAKSRSKEFIVFKQWPVITSARKLDWYSSKEKLFQLLKLLIPGATRSKSKLGMWYDRSHLDDK